MKNKKLALIATSILLVGICVMFSTLTSNERSPKHHSHAPHYFQTVEIGHWPYPTR